MPCEVIKSKKAITYFCYSNETEPELPPCYVCGKPSTKLCDYRGYAVQVVNVPNPPPNEHFRFNKRVNAPSLNTCDKPMCDGCANSVGDDTDYCNEHYNEFSMSVTSVADVAFSVMCDRLLG